MNQAIATPPDWLTIQPVSQASNPILDLLDPGEREAILLAQEFNADLILLDNMKARRAAKNRGLNITGILGILDRAATMKLIDLLRGTETARVSMIIDPQNVSGKKSSNYPQEFQKLVAGRIKKKLGNVAGLKNFGVNLVTLEPGSRSALRHWHSKQDEFIYIVSGEATLVTVTNAGEQILQAGMAAGFPAGEEDGHHLLNKSDTDVVYLEIGDRTLEDTVDYPDDDLIAKDKDGVWIFTHKDGSVYDS